MDGEVWGSPHTQDARRTPNSAAISRVQPAAGHRPEVASRFQGRLLYDSEVQGMAGRKRRCSAESVWLLTADPPLCGEGDAVAVLNSCERRRRALDSLCRFDAAAMAGDLEVSRGSPAPLRPGCWSTSSTPAS